MKKTTIGLAFVVVWLLLCICFLPAAAQPKPPAPSTPQSQASVDVPGLPEVGITVPGHVVVEGRQILTVYEPVGTFTPEERASRIAERIVAAGEGGVSPEAIRLQPRQAWTEILLGDDVIMAVTDVDAKTAGVSRQQLATEDADRVREAVQNYRLEHGWRLILRGVLYTVLATLVMVAVLWVLRRIRFALRDRVERRIQASAQLEKKSPWNISIAYLGPLALAMGSLLRWLVIFALAETYLTIALSFFPHTRSISLSVTRWLFSQLGALAQSALDYLPNLMVVAVIALITYYITRLLSVIFGEIQKGELKIRGFYPDWAEPTEKLIRMLVLVLAVIVAFPYLPGARSPAFQGISIFLGLLLSLGSSSAVANAIAGVILTYMRSFLVGDWVQIGDTTGEVIEKNMLVTRVLNPKAEVITIPNATVMNGSVKNYSIEARKSGVIFHTTVTIGYDAPWRTVHQLLINAALATKHVLPEPPPYVRQRALNDFYVTYEVNAYTDTPSRWLSIYSDLHQNIQDKFNEAGVEICSPHFAALRDGNTIAVPKQYVDPEYRAPGFRLDPTATEKSG
jgi:small-conductance mechanosensitive channel